MKYVNFEYTHYDVETSAAMGLDVIDGKITMTGTLPHGAVIKLTQEVIDGLQELLNEQKAWMPRYTRAQMETEYGHFFKGSEMVFAFQSLRLFEELPHDARALIEKVCKLVLANVTVGEAVEKAIEQMMETRQE